MLTCFIVLQCVWKWFGTFGERFGNFPGTVGRELFRILFELLGDLLGTFGELFGNRWGTLGELFSKFYRYGFETCSELINTDGMNWPEKRIIQARAIPL